MLAKAAATRDGSLIRKYLGLGRSATCGSAFPLAFQHPVDDMISEFIVEPFCLAYDTLLLKTKALRDCSALAVSDRAADIDAVEVEFTKSMIDERTARLSHDALALKPLSKPVARPAHPVLPVNPVMPDEASKLVAMPDASDKTRVVSKLLLRPLDKVHCVRDDYICIQPGQPPAQMMAV